MGFGDLLEKAGRFLSGTWDKTVETGESVASVASLPVGTVLDTARFLTGREFDDGPLGDLGIGESFGSAADLLIGEGTLTGWAMSTIGEASATAFEHGSRPFEAAWYKTASWLGEDSWSPSAGISWSEAWDAAKENNVGESTLLIGNDILDTIADGFGIEDADGIVRSIPIVGPYLENAGVGDEANRDIAASDAKAWEEFSETSPFWSGVTSSVINLTAMFALDPALLALRATKPIGDFVDAMRADDRLNALTGTVKYEDATPTAEAAAGVIDDLATTGAPMPTRTALVDQPGWLDGKSAAQVYAGLKLDGHAYGDQLAALLARTNEIDDVAARVNVRRDIVASASGDPSANRRLRDAAENGAEYADVLSNAFMGRATGSNIAYVSDAMRSADIAEGRALPAYDTPAVVADVERELSNQAGLSEWLYASLGERTLRPTASGERAIARLQGQGLGRDGTLHTGFTKLDQVVNDRVLNRPNSTGSLVDDALDSSEEFVRPAASGLAGGRVYQALQRTWSRGPNSMPLMTNPGIRIAGWASGYTPTVKGAAKVSDALRGRVLQGALNLEDEHLTIAVTQDLMRRAGVPAERSDSILSDVVAARTTEARGQAVRRAENEAIEAVGAQHGLSAEFVRSLAERGTLYRDSRLNVIRGQVYSAHKKTGADGEPMRGDHVLVVDHDGAELVPVSDKAAEVTEPSPILNSQTINFQPLVDLDYAQKWLKRDVLLGAVDRFTRNLANPGVGHRRATELGFTSPMTRGSQRLAENVRAVTEDVNTWWKRGVLLPRLGYPIRNATEEVLRAWAVGRGAANASRAVDQALQEARSLGRRDRGSVEALAKRNLHQAELDELKELRDSPDLQANRAAIQAELDSLRVARAAAAEAGGDTAEIDSAISFMESMPLYVEATEWDSEITALEKTVKELNKLVGTGRPLPDSGERTLPAHGSTRFPEAHHGTEGAMFYELTRGGGAFDNDVTGFAERTFSRHRGVGEPDILQVRFDSAPDVLSRHAQAWSWVVNKQIAQDDAARIALEKMSRGEDGIAAAVTAYLESPRGSAYRAGNPLRSRDTEDWGQAVEQMVTHYVPSENLAGALLDGEVPVARLLEDFAPDARPDVHMAGVESVVNGGLGARKLEVAAGRLFRFYDEMSVQRASRHPLFTVFFNEEQSRLADAYLRKVKTEQGPDATLTVDDVNTVTTRARKEARRKLMDTMYDVSYRSSAAQQLRFIYPFFAAHQNSMTFWGRAIAHNPGVLRKLQLAFDAPRQVGLVVDSEGNPVEPGEFPSSDHYLLMQMPESWGGPALDDPTTRRGQFKISESAFNLMMPNGSIINPGAGPLAAVPVGHVQNTYGAMDDDLSKALRWFNPFGAPDNTADAFLPNPVRRARELWDAHQEQNSREYAEMWSLYMNEAQVAFYAEHDRTPTRAEVRKMEKSVGDKVKHTAMLRTFAAFTSPVQPTPTTALSGMVDEYRRLQGQARDEGRGPFWAADTFLNTYGDEYIALTQSDTENRALLNPTSAAVKALEDHRRLTDTTSPETWRVIVGPNGEGGFSQDAYRWMRDKSVGDGTGETVIDDKGRREREFDIAVAAGYRQFTKLQDLLRLEAEQRGVESYVDDPVLVQVRREMMGKLREQFPDWYSEYVDRAADVTEFETNTLSSLRTIVADRRLSRDPMRTDIRLIGDYLELRDYVGQLLSERRSAGGSDDIAAESNLDVAMAFTRTIDVMADRNTMFADYALPGLIDRDPYYRPDLAGGVAGLAGQN